MNQKYCRTRLCKTHQTGTVNIYYFLKEGYDLHNFNIIDKSGTINLLMIKCIWISLAI